MFGLFGCAQGSFDQVYSEVQMQMSDAGQRQEQIRRREDVRQHRAAQHQQGQQQNQFDGITIEGEYEVVGVKLIESAG